VLVALYSSKPRFESQFRRDYQNSMKTQSIIEQKLAQALSPQHFEVINESNNHSVPANSETHFKVILVCKEFDGVRKVARHQKIYAVLADELAAGVHALAIHAYTEAEWRTANGDAPASPDCAGGSK